MKYVINFEKYSSLKVSLDGKTKMKIDIDDEIKGGKFKNKKIKVKKIGINAKGDIAINDKPFSKFRTNESVEPMISYWKIPTSQPHVKIALKKIGISDDWYKYWCDIFAEQNLYLGDNGFCYMYRNKAINSDKTITYNWTTSSLKYKHIQPHWKYMGEVKIEDWELEPEKYNL